MIRAYVVDDERLAVERLTRLLTATKRVEIVGAEIDPEAALTFLQTHPVDVLFLDIQMPGMTGFELLERLEAPPLVIFTTAFDRYALNAFGVNSIDYLLKPIEADRLDRALDKIERFAGQPRPDMRALARELAAALAPNRRLERIASRVSERTTRARRRPHQPLRLERQADLRRRRRPRARGRSHAQRTRNAPRRSPVRAYSSRDYLEYLLRAGAVSWSGRPSTGSGRPERVEGRRRPGPAEGRRKKTELSVARDRVRGAEGTDLGI